MADLDPAVEERGSSWRHAAIMAWRWPGGSARGILCNVVFPRTTILSQRRDSELWRHNLSNTAAISMKFRITGKS